MGLAEISPNNPLKVIHSELDENDDNKNDIGFVGISNWALDASKMNRGVHLSIQEPELNDLILTAETISSNIYEGIKNIDPFIEIIRNLTKSYHDYKEHLKLKYSLSYDFHGARDFYYLIRIAAKLLKNNNNNISPENIAMESIERNFGGLELDLEDNTKWSSTKKFKQIFSGHQKNNIQNIDKYDVFSCIYKNLTEENNRYLLLMTDRTKSDTLIEFILKKLNLNFRFIQGSKLKEDQNEQYTLQKAYSIILSMEKGEVIILKDLEILYPKFYDLFNQNLQKHGNSSYARIVLDSTTNERHIVNKDFRCIILLEKGDVKDQDPPFLNRFEKHLMSFNYLLNEKQKLISKELYEEIIELTSLSENKKNSPLLVNINIEEIRCLIFELSQRVNGDELEKNIAQIYKLIIPTFTQENILSCLFSTQEKFIKKEDLIKIYNENSHTSISKFLEKVERNKIIIYTFSQFYKDIFTETNKIQINNPKFGNICKENTIEIKFNVNLSENMLNYFFKMYYEQNNANLFIMHFKVKDTKYLKYVKFQLDDFHQTNKENERKIFIFIIHIEKNYELQNNKKGNEDHNQSVEYLERYHSFFFSFISEYQQITIDNLLEQRNISIIDLYNKSNEELLVIKELFDTEKIIKTEFSRQITQMPSNQEISTLIQKLDNLVENGVLNCIIKKIQNFIKNSDNLLKKILIDYSFLIEKDNDFMSYFVERTEKLISENVEKLINELGESGYLVSFIFEKDIPQKIKDTIFSFIENLNLSKSKSRNNNENYLIDLKVPGSRLLIKKMLNLLKICKIEYINKEDEYRKKKDNKKKETKTLEDVHYEKKQYLINKLWNEELLTENIFNDYSKEIIQDMFCLLFFNKISKIDINKNINKNQEEFLMFLYEQKIISEDINNMRILDKFLSFFLWIGSYRETIFKLFEIIIKLDKYFISDNDLTIVQYLKNIYNTIVFPSEKDKEKTIEKEKVNGIFYKISESICYIITDINRMDYKSIEDLELLCSVLNEVTQVFSQFNSTLSLSLRTYYSIISIVKFIEYYKKHRGMTKNDFINQLISFIKSINEEQELISKNEFSKAKEKFVEQIKIVINLSYELSMKIFVNKYLQYSKYQEYKIQLVKLIFVYPKLIKYSSLFFNYIFLTQSIKPKKQIKALNEREKEESLSKFGEIKNKIKDEILTEINRVAQTNEILKEILIYIFELRILSYFEDCQKTKFVKDSKREILVGLNFDYFKNACNNVNNQDYGRLNNLGMIFYFSFIRCYLEYFVKLQLQAKQEKKDLGDLSVINMYFFNIYNSPLGKMLSLYIANLFIVNKEKDYFLTDYLNDEKNYNWKKLIISQNKKNQLFPILNYENAKHLLFSIWTKINNEKLTDDFIKSLEINDLYYLLNISYNEIIQKPIKDNELAESVILSEINKKKNNFTFSININEKLKKLFDTISNSEFFKEEKIKSNLKLVFYILNLYVIGFAGNKINSLFSLIFSDNISFLIKIMYLDNLKAYILFIENYYKIKNYLEEKYVKEKINLPAYICCCGKWHPFPIEENNCNCGKKIGGNNEDFMKRTNHYIIYYDEEQKNLIKNGAQNEKINASKIPGKLLEDYKKEFILNPLLNKLPKLNQLLLSNNNVNEDTITKIFIKFIFLCQVFVEYKIKEMSEEEKKREFGEVDLFEEIIKLKQQIENYFKQKGINFDEFMNYFCDVYCTLLKTMDCVKPKEVYFNYINNNINKRICEDDQTFNNIETNILTTLAFEPNFKNENFKYLLTATKYPNIDELKSYIDVFFKPKNENKIKKKALPILNAFISNEKNNKEMDKLSHIETLNDFINTFSEINWNLISRQKSENDEIKNYLNRKEGQQEKSPLEIQFDEFAKSYNQITHVEPFNITSDQPVKTILNDEKNKSQIYKIYEKLIEIQNKFLNEVIQQYDKMESKEKEDIIIKNIISQIKQEIPIQQATKSDIFSFEVRNNIILSFEELFSFYSLKHIFNKKDDKIDYSKYSNLKFKLNMIEKELINIILTGKKMFSEKQITYKFYLDEVEEKSKKFNKFTKLYDFEEISEEDKIILSKQIEDDMNLKKIFLQNLEILINYLIKENKYQGKQSISDIKFASNLYLNQNFIQIFKNYTNLTINKLVSIYDYMEQLLWKFIANRYINSKFIGSGFFSKQIHMDEINNFIDEENKRELKNEMLVSLLIKFICRYLPNASEEILSKDLFGTIQEINPNLSEGVRKDLLKLKEKLGAGIIYAKEITDYLEQKVKIKIKNNQQNENNGVNNGNQNPVNNEEKPQEEAVEEEEEEDRDL